MPRHRLSNSTPWEKAIINAKRTLIQDHLDHCLEDTIGVLPRDQRQSIDEFKAITKYL